MRQLDGGDDRRAQADAIINGIMDPCSIASAVPIGLVDMGIVREITISDDGIKVRLLPTFPDCLLTPIFQSEIAKRLTASLAWCKTVEVTIVEDDVIWDETQMSAAGRAALARSRAARRDRPAAPGFIALPLVPADD